MSTAEASLTPVAEVIRFPERPEAADRRLSNALAQLDAALEAQREAVADWRRALAELRTTVGTIGDGLRRYDQTLTGLGHQVGALGDQARTLERWAEAALAKKWASRYSG